MAALILARAQRLNHDDFTRLQQWPDYPALRNTREGQRCCDEHLYQARQLIENFFARLKQYRAITTRCDKTARNFLGAIHLAGAMVSFNY